MISPREAEVACEKYFQSFSPNVETRRTIRTKWARVDFFGADVIATIPPGAAGKEFPDGYRAWAQVTTAKESGSVSVRRRKLEKRHWFPIDRVFVFEMREARDIVNRRKMKLYFRIHEWEHRNGGGWRIHNEAVEVPREWLKAKHVLWPQAASEPKTA